MAVHDGVDIRPRPIGLAVNESLKEQAAASRVDGIGIEIELHNVFRRDEGGGAGPGEKKAFGISGMANADVPPSVEDAIPHKYAVRCDKVVDDGRLNGTARENWIEH
jgi:hypothetical protein